MTIIFIITTIAVNLFGWVALFSYMQKDNSEKLLYSIDRKIDTLANELDGIIPIVRQNLLFSLDEIKKLNAKLNEREKKVCKTKNKLKTRKMKAKKTLKRKSHKQK